MLKGFKIFLLRGNVGGARSTTKCPECLSEVPVAALRCGFCTQPWHVPGRSTVGALAREIT